MYLKPEIIKKQHNFKLLDETKAKIKKMSEVEKIPMGQIIAQLVERQWEEGKYGKATG